MGNRIELFNLEKHFAFYGAYHSNPANIVIHMLFVWPIFFTAILLLDFTPSLFNLPHIDFSLSGVHVSLIFNFGFLFALVYAVFYMCLDVKAGTLAALLCGVCWIVSSVLATRLGFSLAWKCCMVAYNISGVWNLFQNMESLSFSHANGVFGSISFPSMVLDFENH
ncbi:putative endoplasmic reticulum membrane protein YGL010W-like protein [Gossypium australe]|uniref:Putative endoplasmic reticulum membrane protein YGL010W-like protein n=1 Tax=Gossypium australe TaxID=47621 RepID=A0A5B6UX92_9ROSI|nr:putative endoplasmic reticulum membrane protein YGL010W-like protein [Gossypium australe]